MNNNINKVCTSCEEGHEQSVSDIKTKDEKKFSTSDILTAVVVVLVIMSGIQVYQTQKLLGAVSNGVIKADSGQAQGGTIGLPSQVGGCG